MRIALTLLPAALLAACNSDPATTSITAATTTVTTATTADPTDTQTTQEPDPTSTGATTDMPTGGSITGNLTESGTTSTTSTTEVTGSDTGGSTSPVQTDTGPSETTTGNTTTGDTTTGNTTGEPGSTDTSGGEESSTGPIEEACPCPDLEVPLDDGIFVLADNAALWKYFPETNAMVLLGTPKCDLAPITFSMAVDRLGFAWIEYTGGQLRKVSVSDLNVCTDPGFMANQQGIKNFGMAFVSNSISDKCDRLFGSQYTSLPEGPKIANFFSIDPVTQQMMPLGKSDFGTAEVSGTGDGRAFLFAPTNISQLVEVNKQTGATLSKIPLPGVLAGSGWAFAFFAGDFYFFTESQGDGKSEVTHIDYDDSDNNGKQDITVVLNNAPLKIVGAGVSTCAPTFPQ